jgi:hypothetical protein
MLEGWTAMGVAWCRKCYFCKKSLVGAVLREVMATSHLSSCDTVRTHLAV